jgi:hypothetical protein
MKRSFVALLLALAAGGTSRAESPAAPDPFDVKRTADGCDCGCACVPDPCCTAPAVPRVWGSVDYLLWWVRKGETPPLVVTGPPTDAFPGALDQPNTRILFGDHGLDYGKFNGLRASFGAWLDDESRFGAEASGFVLERRSVQYNARGDANGQPFLATPFVNAVTGNDNVYFISQNFADPNISAMLTGGVGIFSATRLWSWDVNAVASLVRNDAWKVNVLAGFRQLSLRENLSHVTTVNNLTPEGASVFLTVPIDPAFTVTTIDSFGTSNLFNGGQLGARVDRRWGVFILEVTGKVALGSVQQDATIQGLTRTTAPLPVTEAVGGIFAQGSNIGHFSRDTFAVVPEIGVNFAVNVTANVRARVGYTFVYVSSVARPGDQIDTAINVNRVPIDINFGTPGGPNRPAFDMKTTGFWAQGVNFGLEFRF